MLLFFFFTSTATTEIYTLSLHDALPISWTTATFDHSTTGFPLTNSHQLAPAGKVTACTDCHINNRSEERRVGKACRNSGCHLTTWQQTTNPKHSAAPTVFPVANCSTCHTTTT